MTLPSILGVLGTIIGLVRALPQLMAILRTRRAAGVSVDTAAISAIVSFGWAGYIHTDFWVVSIVHKRNNRCLKAVKG